MPLDDHELKTKAYLRCDKAMRWLALKAANSGQAKYLDEYVLFLDAPKGQKVGPMVYAEALLTFFDVFDWNKANSEERQLPCLDIEQFCTEVEYLVKIFSEQGLSGVPYLWENSKPADKQAEFTDAACFVGLAFHVALENLHNCQINTDFSERVNNITEELKKSYRRCILWLLENQIIHPHLPNSVGWGWSGLKGVAEYKAHYVPPQTYFTCSALITLSEALTAHFDLFKEDSIKIIDTIDRARQFLVSSLVFGNGKPGWIDFIPISDHGDYPHCIPGTISLGGAKLDRIQRSELHSFYVFEVFGYLKRNLKVLLESKPENMKTALSELINRISENSQNVIEPAVLSILSDIEEASENWQVITRMPARSLLPKGINERQDNYYVDGSTLANCWNAYEVFCRESSNQALIDRWNSLRGVLIEELLSASGIEGGFPSLIAISEMETGKSYAALYATRSSINTLIKYGLEPPPEENRAALQEIELRLRSARQSIDEAKDRLLLLRGEDIGVLPKTGYMAAYHFANALNHYECIVIELSRRELSSDVFLYHQNADQSHPTYEITENKCRNALGKYRQMLLKLASAEDESQFRRIIGEFCESQDFAYLPAISINKLTELSEWAGKNKEMIPHAYARFSQLTDFISDLSKSLGKRLPGDVL